jgi:NADP-dependent 3-hydroxy acid dehydrogenase YdfG
VLPLAVSGSLTGQAALVTGASRGIGFAIARALAGAGARVLCLARPGPALDSAVSSLGAGATAVPCDLADGGDVERAVGAIRQITGEPPDLLVQNAGLFTLSTIDAGTGTEFARAIETNLVGPYRILHGLVPEMRRRGTGHVVTIGSMADRAAYPENAAYAASKYAARAVHEVLREELRGTGVRTTLVSPGPVDTTIWDPIDPDRRPGFTPRARMLHADAVADAVLWVVTRPGAVNVDELRLSRS